MTVRQLVWIIYIVVLIKISEGILNFIYNSVMDEGTKVAKLKRD